MIKVNTDKMKEYGNDIIGLSQNLNSVIQEMYTRILNVSTVTREWQGESADKFVNKAKKDKIIALNLKQKVYKLGVTLVKSAENYETDVKELLDRW